MLTWRRLFQREHGKTLYRCLKYLGYTYIQAERCVSVRVGCLAWLQHIQVRAREPHLTGKRHSYCKGVSHQSSPAPASVFLVPWVCLFIPTTPTPVLAPHQRTHVQPFSLAVRCLGIASHPLPLSLPLCVEIGTQSPVF